MFVGDVVVDCRQESERQSALPNAQQIYCLSIYLSASMNNFAYHMKLMCDQLWE